MRLIATLALLTGTSFVDGGLTNDNFMLFLAAHVDGREADGGLFV